MSFEKIRQRKGQQRIVMLTAYDYQIAKILDSTDIDMILVGDSSGMVVQGYKDTKSVTMEDMLFHTKAVSRASTDKPIIGDMPINAVKTPKDALENAWRFLEAGADAVKIEGNRAEAVKALIDEKIPVMGHVGMLPQGAEEYHVKGKDPEEGQRISEDAMDLDRLGAFSIVLECIPESLAKKITDSVKAPTIGIGAGKYCDGQVLVTNDMLGMDADFKPKYVKTYVNLNLTIADAVRRFAEEVRVGKYPDDQHTYH